MKFEPKLYHLSNGTTIILDPMDLATTTVKIKFATGSRDESPESHGITHFCEHMLIKGTKKFPTRKAIKDYLENKGGVFNAGTTNRSLMLYGRIIAQNTDDLLEVFADILQNSKFDSEKINLERGVILDELHRGLGSNQRKYVDFIDKNLFGYSAFRTLGTKENIQSFTREQMLDWVHKRLSGKNCTICISGRIDNEELLLKKLQELFEFLPAHDVATNKELHYTPCDKFLHEPSLKNVWISVLFPYIRPETYENMPKDIAESKFHKYLMQELGEVLRQQNGLVYGLDMVNYGNEIIGVRGLDTEVTVENLGRVVALMAQTAYRVYNHDKITQQIIDRFYNINKLADADFLESAAHRRDVLISHWEDFGKLYDYDRIVKLDEGITVKDVLDAANGFFDGPMSIMSFGPEHNLDLRQIWKDNFK